MSSLCRTSLTCQKSKHYLMGCKFKIFHRSLSYKILAQDIKWRLDIVHIIPSWLLFVNIRSDLFATAQSLMTNTIAAIHTKTMHLEKHIWQEAPQSFKDESHSFDSHGHYFKTKNLSLLILWSDGVRVG